jgi:hypothetical protein
MPNRGSYNNFYCESLYVMYDVQLYIVQLLTSGKLPFRNFLELILTPKCYEAMMIAASYRKCVVFQFIATI